MARTGGRGEQQYLGRCVETHAEHHSDGVHVPFLVYGLHPATEEAVEKTTVLELAFQFGLVVLASWRMDRKTFIMPTNTTRLSKPMRNKKDGRDERSRTGRQIVRSPELVLDDSREHGLFGDDDADAGGHDDGLEWPREKK